MPRYGEVKASLVVIACCALHNFIKTVTLNDELFQRWSSPDYCRTRRGVDEASEASHPLDMSNESSPNYGCNQGCNCPYLCGHLGASAGRVFVTHN